MPITLPITLRVITMSSTRMSVFSLSLVRGLLMCYFNLKIPLQNEGRDSQVKRSECFAHFIPFFIAHVQRIFFIETKKFDWQC